MKIIGHRGAGGLAADNTLTSILKALENDVDAIEVDVRLTKDRVPILAEPGVLEDAAGKRMGIADHTLEELRVNWPDLATLEEAVRNVDREVPAILNIKPLVSVEPILKTVQGFLDEGWRPQDFAFASASQKTLRECQQAFPNIRLIVIERWSGVRAGWRARKLGTKHVSINHRALWFFFIQSMRRSNYKLYAYTLNNPRQAKRWARSGLYAVITDYPDRFHHP